MTEASRNVKKDSEGYEGVGNKQSTSDLGFNGYSRMDSAEKRDFGDLDKLSMGIGDFKVDLEYYKNIVDAQSKKLMVTEDLRKQLELARSQISKYEEEKKELRQAIEDFKRDIEVERETNTRYQNEIIKDNNEKSEKLTSIEKELADKESKIESLNGEVSKIQKELIQQHLFQQQIEYQTGLTKQLEQDLKTSEDKRKALQETYEQAVQKFAEQAALDSQEKKKLADDKLMLERRILGLETELVHSNANNERLKQENSDKANKIIELDQKLVVLSDVKNQHETISASFESLLAEHKITINKVELLHKEFESIKNADYERHVALTQKLEQQMQEILQKDKEISDKDQVIKAITQKNLDQQAQITSLEELLCIKEDIASQIDSASELAEILTVSNERLQKEVESAANNLIIAEEKLVRVKQMVLQLKGTLHEREEEIMLLREHILELKSRSSVYIPVRDDIIDARLADFVNSHHDASRLRLMFIREAQGLYLFGTKRVLIKIEKEQIVVRVGGGYLLIDEFVELYLPIEFEKLYKKNPDRKVSEKIALQKALFGRSVASPSRDRSKSPGGFQ